MFGYGAAHVGFVDEHGVEVGVARCFGSVAKDHARGVFDALDGETERCETVQFAEALVELLKRAERVVRCADELKVDAGGSDAGFCVGDAEDDDLVATLLQTPRECGHWINVSGAGKAECSEPRHISYPHRVNWGPR